MLPAAGFRRAKAEITAWPGYAATPLRDLPDLASRAGIGTLRLKDESGRFGLGSFKALGGAYAVAILLCNELARTGVAPAATTADLEAGTYRAATAAHHRHVRDRRQPRPRRRLGRAALPLHAASSSSTPASARPAPTRSPAMARRSAASPAPMTTRSANAPARRTPTDWHVVSDTSWPGYTEIPRDIMQGYRLMADEAADQWTGPPPTHVFIQGGVGGAAAAVSVQCRARFDPTPALIVVEPDRAACLLASAELGEPHRNPGRPRYADGGPRLRRTQSAGLAGTGPRRRARSWRSPTMRRWPRCVCWRPRGIVAGEFGVAGLAGCLLAAADPAARATLGLDSRQPRAAFSTEGDTDPDLYTRLVGDFRHGSRHG